MTPLDTKKLAEKIAKIIESGPQVPDLTSLFAGLEKINHRLAKLEQSISITSSTTPDLKPPHPSMDKFNVAEAIADELFAGIQKEKTCTFEPNGKPCDHCSMCSSRGF